MNENDLAALRECHARMGGILDRMQARREAAGNEAGDDFRRYAGGPLNERGEAEINSRFQAGQTDSQIALGMSVSLAGVSKRRTMWRRRQAK